MFAAAWWYYGPRLLLVSRLVLGCALIVLFAIDLEHQLLPNVITIPGIVVGFAFSFVTGPAGCRRSSASSSAAACCSAIAEAYYRLRHEEGLGMGDVKMLAMIGAFLGWRLTLVTLMMASIAGSIVGVLIIALRRGDMKYALPFGTFLAMGAVLAATIGPACSSWYWATGESVHARARHARDGTPHRAAIDARDRRRSAVERQASSSRPMPDTQRLCAGRPDGVVAALAAALAFALLQIPRGLAAMRRRRGGSETRCCPRPSAKRSPSCKAQERATAARAEASERMSDEIIASLTAGLLVVGLNGRVRILNPAGRRMLRVPELAPLNDYRRLLGEPALSDIIDECFATRGAILRRNVQLPVPGTARRTSG